MQIDNVAEFCLALHHLKFTWITGGKIKYVDFKYDTRSREVFSITFYGGLHPDINFSSTNNTRYWDASQMAIKWANIAHEIGVPQANAWYERLKQWGLYRDKQTLNL